MANELPVEPGVSLELAQYRAQNLSGLKYELYFDVPAESNEPIAATAKIRFALASNRQALQLDFHEDTSLLHRLVVNGEALAIDHRQEHLVIPAVALVVGDNLVEVAFTAGGSSLNRNPDYLHTLFVPDRARTAFPLFDQPDLKATFDLTLDLPPGWRAQANGALASRKKVDGKQRHVFNTSAAISSYLFAFVAGEFESVRREVDGRWMTMLHRETDAEKVARNVDAIFRQHAEGIAWMEEYTGIAYPFEKFDFALIPGFAYGGMEHVGAIFYRAEKLLLEEDPTDRQLLDRATLIAHETAHMWFGNLVTMAWFDDVWTKEVFANFMAAKMVNPQFPDIDHQLGFLVDHYPAAYEVDRSTGANPIRQVLPNLNEAGQMYGSIIYHKAPIMMRQLEWILGDKDFRKGMQQYLQRYAGVNATWPGLIAILDPLTATDLRAWSAVWVNSPGRPEIQLQQLPDATAVIRQRDPAGEGRVWPQRFAVQVLSAQAPGVVSVASSKAAVAWPGESLPEAPLLFNADASGYGLFPVAPQSLDYWQDLGSLQRGVLLLDLNENLLAGLGIRPVEQVSALLTLLQSETNTLVLGLALDQLAYSYQTLLTDAQQRAVRDELEQVLWQRLQQEGDSGRARQFYEAWSTLAVSPDGLQRMLAIWSGKHPLEQITRSERDDIRLAEILALRLPKQAKDILAAQLARCKNPDNRRRLAFVAPSLSADASERDVFFASLADETNRQTESWVLDALGYLHHPSRTAQSVKYLPDTLVLLASIQRTGDIFFPMGWLRSSFYFHNSARAIAVVEQFLATNPGYSAQLRMKIQQAADRPARAVTIRRGG